MATDAEALAAGFVLPNGSDLISGGDDAISQNARATLDLFAPALKLSTVPISETDDIFALEPSVYPVDGLGVNNPQLPYKRAGELWVTRVAGSPRSIIFTTNDIGDVRNGARMFIIGSDGSGSFAGRSWREVTSNARGLPGNHAIDVWAGNTGYNGSFAPKVSDVAAAGSKSPTNFQYVLEHETQPNGASWQTARAAHAGDQGIYHRAETSGGSGEFTLWKRLMDERMSPALNRHELLYEEMAAAHGGKIFTGDAVPVALTFDDYPRDFRDRIMPLLASRGLPCTIGLSSKMYEETSTVIQPGAVGTTWAEIDAWPSWITVANHSATHRPAEDRFSMFQQIVTGLKDLQAALPNKPIYTFMQPAVAYDAGFDNGNTLESYAGTIAGHMQLGHHAYVTGLRRTAGMATTCVMVGNRPIQGLVRNWLDTKSGIDIAQARITSARPKKHGLILAAHADRFGLSGMATMAEITAFLDWLKAEQDAGRVKVLTLEQFAIAQYGAPAPIVSNDVGRTVHVWDTLNQREQLIYGYTGVRDVSAVVTGLTGQVLLSRDGNNVTLEFNNVSPTGTGLVDFMYLPQGFRIGRTTYRWLQTTAGGMSRSFQLYASGNSRINSADPSDSYRQSFTFPTLDPWPTSLPGSAA